MALVVGVVSVTRPTHSSLGHEWRTAAYGIVPIAGGVVFSLPALPGIVWGGVMFFMCVASFVGWASWCMRIRFVREP